MCATANNLSKNKYFGIFGVARFTANKPLKKWIDIITKEFTLSNKKELELCGEWKLRNTMSSLAET